MKFFIIILVTLAVTLTHGAPTLSAKCVEPVEAGTCSLKLPRFYYDTKTGECKEFRYGGCRGNNNRFGTKEFCEKECIKSSTVVTTPKQDSKKNTPTTAPTLDNKKNTPTIVVTPPIQDNKRNIPVVTPTPANKNNAPVVTPILAENKRNGHVVTPTPQINKNKIVNSPTPKKKVTFA